MFLALLAKSRYHSDGTLGIGEYLCLSFIGGRIHPKKHTGEGKK